MAIDYGAKRCGIAITDPLQIIASGLDTISTKELKPFLKSFLSKEEVDCIVLGEPRRLNNEISEIEKEIIPLINFLQNQFPNLKIDRQDERFTSKIALQSMIEGGLKKKKRGDKALVDKVSATLILQAYLERKQ